MPISLLADDRVGGLVLELLRIMKLTSVSTTTAATPPLLQTVLVS
jgi:hypothetical protein